MKSLLWILIDTNKEKIFKALFTRSRKMCSSAKGPKHGPALIPEEGKWVKD
jgi:hypothetical protein